MMKTVGLYLLSFSSYWENSRTHRLFGWDTYCSAPTMGLLNTSEVKVFDWKVALDPGIAWGDKSRTRLLQKSENISTFFKKSENFPTIIWKLGGFYRFSLGPANPVLAFPWTQGYAMQSLAALALTGTECIKSKHTNKLSSLYIRWNQPIKEKVIL